MKRTKKTKMKNKKKQTKKQFFFNPEDPKKSFNVYIDKDPTDTINIKYSTIGEVKNTIKKLERLYKQKKYPHKRIFQVAMIMMVRLGVIVKRYSKGKKRYAMSKRYKNFLNKRTKLKGKKRYKSVFKFFTKKKKKPKYKKLKNSNKYYKMSKRQYLLKKCGLPDVPETQHCFNDGTHHTCCKLGKKAREYADASDNPIGKLSADVFYKKHKRYPNKNEKTSWCTCSGSEVCGFYSDKFKDTKIEFVNNPNKNQIAKNVKGKKCESYVRDFMGVMPHGTPGVVSENGGKCEDKDVIKFSDIHY